MWAKSSGWINKYEEGNYTLKGRQSAGNYYGKGSKYKAKGRYSSDSIMEGNLWFIKKYYLYFQLLIALKITNKWNHWTLGQAHEPDESNSRPLAH